MVDQNIFVFSDSLVFEKYESGISTYLTIAANCLEKVGLAEALYCFSKLLIHGTFSDI